MVYSQAKIRQHLTQNYKVISTVRENAWITLRRATVRKAIVKGLKCVKTDSTYYSWKDLAELFIILTKKSQAFPCWLCVPTICILSFCTRSREIILNSFEKRNLLQQTMVPWLKVLPLETNAAIRKIKDVHGFESLIHWSKNKNLAKLVTEAFWLLFQAVYDLAMLFHVVQRILISQSKTLEYLSWTRSKLSSNTWV